MESNYFAVKVEIYAATIPLRWLFSKHIYFKDGTLITATSF